jgi:tetratricopeptide (TPR) repeat protein
MQLGIDLRSRIKAAITRDLWIRGHSLSAEEAAWAAVHETAELGHPLAHATSMVFNASVFFWQRDLPAAEEIVRRLSDHAQRHLLPAYSAVGLGMEGMLDLGHGDYEGASRKLREALDTLETLHFQVVTPWFMGAFAECRTALGQRDEGLAIVEEALLLVIRNGDRANLPDLLRIKGELLASHPSDRRAAVMALREALAWSTAQGAPAWNLRAAISLARLHRDDGRAEEAALVLRKAMADFEQVEESMDYSIASEMLEELRPISRSC